MAFLDGFSSLGRDVNKVRTGEDETKEGIASPVSPVLTLETPDEDLLTLARKWEQLWQVSESKKNLERKQEENERYWLADHSTPAQRTAGKRELTDNLVFEAVETALPFYTKQHAEPLVSSDETPEGQALSRKVGDRIKDLADTLRLRLKVKKAVRHWSLYYLACMKLGWSMARNEIAVQVVRPQHLVLDPDAVTDECEYDGDYLGHIKTDSAEDLITRFPEKKDYISEKVGEKLATKLRYVEYWTPDILFWKMESEILGKSKNPHWNYETSTLQTTVDEFGQEVMGPVTVPAVNHFSSRKIPFAFLSVFNLGKGPYDDTNLVEQVLALQDVVNKRQRQIDRNADSMNSGAVVSGDGFTKEQAKQVADALRKGLTIWVPAGDVNRVYKRDSGQPLPEFVYNSLVDYRNEIRNIFGVTGLTAQGIQKTETVRGKILVRATDADRNPLADHLEQFYDYIYNWFVQLMYVYYDEPHKVNRYQGTTMIVSSEFVNPIVVSVKEGSLIPKDRLTMRNEAIDLWGARAIDPLTLAERLEETNPQEFANRLVLWTLNPVGYAQVYASQVGALAIPPVVEKEPSGGEVKKEEPAKSPNILDAVPIQ